MPMPVVNETARLMFIYRRDVGDDLVNVFHVRRPGPSFNDAEAFLSGVDSAIKPTAHPWMIQIPSTQVLFRYVYYDLHPGSQVNAELATSVPGMTGSLNLPPQVSAVMTWRTPYRGRSFRGRTYYGQLAPGALTPEGRIGGTARDAIAEAGRRLAQTFATLGAPLVVVSTQRDKQPRTTNLSTEVTHITVDNALDVQRRRGHEASAQTTYAI